MFSLSQIVILLSQFLLVTAVGMTIPLLVNFLDDHHHWKDFFYSSMITAGVALMGLKLFPKQNKRLSLREGFLLMSLAWIVVPLFAAIPLFLSLENVPFSDALFESISGLTTTGATVIVGLDQLDRGVLLWRSLLQWLGGIAIVLMAVVMLPKLGVGGMQLFRAEVTDRNEKALPRSTHVAFWITGIYLALTLFAIVAYKIAGMTLFDALNHAMTSIATGGFSTYDQSFGYFNDKPVISWISVAVMITGSLPFILYLRMARGQPLKILTDQQVQYFLALLLGFIGIIVLHLMINNGWEWDKALSVAAFNVTSIMTGTGYANAPYDTWGSFALPFFFAIMVIGGCAGSTSCGIKIFRFVILKEAARVQLNRLLNPNGIFIAYYNKNPIEEHISASVQGFILLFAVTFVLIAWGLALTGLDFLTAMSAAASAIANVGPGLGHMVGPEGNFSDFSVVAKWIMMLGMLIGRMEIYTLIIVLLPKFWKD